MGSGSEELVPWSRARDLVQRAIGADRPGAALASEAIVEAQALGAPEFGIDLLRGWADGDKSGPTSPVVTGSEYLQHWDVEDCFGPLALAHAAEVASAAAQDGDVGVGVVVLHGLAGSGRLAPFVEAIAAHGQVGTVFAASPPLVAAHGGHRPLWGTNPFAVAVPGTADPLTVDASTASITAAQLRQATASGTSLPAGVAVDHDGQGTTDPDEVLALLPRGGLMGTLAAVLVESLTSGLAGRPAAPGWRAATVMAFATDTGIADDLRERISQAGAQVPGDTTRQKLEKAQRDGVSLSSEALAFLTSMPRT